MGEGDFGERLFEGLAYVLIVAGLISLCGIVLFLFIGRQLGTRLTNDLDSMKGELSKKLEVHRLMHQYRADAIDKLYIMLAKLAREVAMVTDYHKSRPDPGRQLKFTVLANAFHQLADHVHENKMYFPDQLAVRMQGFLTDLRETVDSAHPSIITHYTTGLHAPGQSDRWSKLNYDLTILIGEVQNLARGIIGLDAQGEPEPGSSSAGAAGRPASAQFMG
jgi:hypothetical protein